MRRLSSAFSLKRWRIRDGIAAARHQFCSDTVLPFTIPSARPSVYHVSVLYLNECTNRQSFSTIYVGGDNLPFRPKSPFVSEMVRGRPIVTTDH